MSHHVVPLVDSIPLSFGYKQLTTKFHVYIFGIYHTFVAVVWPMGSETEDVTFDWKYYGQTSKILLMSFIVHHNCVNFLCSVL